MYKYFGIGLIVLGLCFLAGCGNSNSGKDETNQVSESGNELYLEDVRGNDMYEMETKEHKEGNIFLEYPQFSDSSNIDFTEKWNKFIEKTTLGYSKNLGENGHCEIKYEIKTKNKEMISILCYGNIYAQGAAHPSNILYTYNISLLTGQSIRLEENNNFSKYVENIFSGKNYSYLKNIEEVDLSDNVREYISDNYEDMSSLEEVLKQYDFKIENDSSALGYSYYENNKTVICMEVPHALGDYVQLIME